MNENESQSELHQSRAKKPYVKPVLVRLGNVRDLTQGGPPGTGDSGMVLNQAIS